MIEIIGVGLAFVGAFAIAMQALCLRIGTSRGTSTEALLVVLAVNLAVIIPLAAIMEYPEYHITTASLVAFVGAGLSGTLLGRIFYFAGIERIGASRAEPIKATQPLHASFLAVFILGESITEGAVVGIVLIVLGVGYISVVTRNDTPPDLESGSVTAFALPFLAAFFLGLEPTFAKLGFAGGSSPLVGLAIKTAVASIVFVIYVLSRYGRSSLVFARENLHWYVAAGVANTTFLGAYYAALEVTKVSIVVPILQTSPILIALLSIVFLPSLERVTPRLITGTLIVVVGAVLITLFG